MADIKLRAPSFEEMIQRRGIAVTWEKAQKCTCWDDYSGHPLDNCLVCKGIGYIYSDPLATRNILVMSLALSKDLSYIGEYQMGDAVATIPMRKYIKNESGLWIRPFNPIFEIGEWDKITLQDTEFRSQEVLRFNDTSSKFGVDTLRNKDVTRVVSILKANPETGELVYYEEETDFNLDGNRIVWENPEIMEVGDKYSVMYYHRPVYVVYTQLPQSRDPDGQHFPKKTILRYQGVI